MITPALIEYVQTLRAANVSEADIKEQLHQAGWQAEDIKQSMSTQAQQQPFVRGVTAQTVLPKRSEKTAGAQKAAPTPGDDRDPAPHVTSMQEVSVGQTTDALKISEQSPDEALAQPAAQLVDSQAATQALQSRLPTVTPKTMATKQAELSPQSSAAADLNTSTAAYPDTPAPADTRRKLVLIIGLVCVFAALIGGALYAIYIF
ncbi:MAG: hypothetical protein WDZ94_04190 [Patescibacteria group bacterium]